MTDNRVKAPEGKKGKEWKIQFLVPSISPVFSSQYLFSVPFLALEARCLSVSRQDANPPFIISNTSIVVHRICRCRIHRPGTWFNS